MKGAQNGYISLSRRKISWFCCTSVKLKQRTNGTPYMTTGDVPKEQIHDFFFSRHETIPND